eukprot:TRINITY_DN3103_c0_g1_i2.p1 TRINITY_DN3103_c0_g1~~TRINITY_DN3103_c0_g1_i2.p1  ORF type:complete len:111 (-),score=1.43 TRINITY_DN3103_c0_g1_i2:406-738(-)
MFVLLMLSLPAFSAAGVSRSSTITLAYMMTTLNITYDQAITILRAFRPIACKKKLRFEIDHTLLEQPHSLPLNHCLQLTSQSLPSQPLTFFAPFFSSTKSWIRPTIGRVL